MTHNEIITNLAQCICTERYFKHWIPDIVYTDGVKLMAELCSAYWLVDEIAVRQKGKLRSEAFQTWTLSRNERSGDWKLIVDDGNGNVLQNVTIPFSDFPLDEITIWFDNGVILLPSEY